MISLPFYLLFHIAIISIYVLNFACLLYLSQTPKSASCKDDLVGSNEEAASLKQLTLDGSEKEEGSNEVFRRCGGAQ